MIRVSEIKTVPPEKFGTPLQENVYRTLERLQIPFERVDTDEVITMEDCAGIEAKLQVKMVKTLFLCTRHQAEYFLFVTGGDKPFCSKTFGAALGTRRVSFAPAETMEAMLGTKIGAATVFSALSDREGRVRIVFDREVAGELWAGCSDGTTTGYLKIETQRILRDFLPFAHHAAEIIEV